MNGRARGFTLVELMVVVLLSSMIMASIYQMVVMQERTSRDRTAIIDTQQTARTGVTILSNELKEISAVDGDIVAATETSIEFRALGKAAISCTSNGSNVLGVAVLGAKFVDGDSVLIFREGDVNTVSDDAWVVARVNAVTQQTVSLCGGNPVGAVDWQELTLDGSPLAGVSPTAALVRSFTPTRYRIQDNGEFGQLMRRVSLPDGTVTEAAILDQLANVADNGLRFRYFDAAGAEISSGSLAANLNNIMRIQITVRGKAVKSASASGENRFEDELQTTVYLRGNFRSL